MKSDFYSKVLLNKSTDKGFTLIELLVVIIIIGVLAAIALPSFLNQVSKAKQSEAKTYIGSVNRAQQAYRIENSQFAPNVLALEIGIPTQTPDYKYEIKDSNGSQTRFEAVAQDNTLLSYTGGILIPQGTATQIVRNCQTTTTSLVAADLVFTPTQPVCSGNSEPME